jgi:hypothetical protein
MASFNRWRSTFASPEIPKMLAKLLPAPEPAPPPPSPPPGLHPLQADVATALAQLWQALQVLYAAQAAVHGKLAEPMFGRPAPVEALNTRELRPVIRAAVRLGRALEEVWRRCRRTSTTRWRH